VAGALVAVVGALVAVAPLAGAAAQAVVVVAAVAGASRLEVVEAAAASRPADRAAEVAHRQ
jgi:hypothetical protein